MKGSAVDVKKINGVTPQLDDTDKLAVSVYGKASAAGDKEILVDSSGHLQVDGVTMPGSAAEGGSLPAVFIVVAGDDGSDVHPLQLDSNGALKAVLQAGSAAIGKLAANSGVDIGDVDIGRRFTTTALTIANSGHLSDELDMRGSSMLIVHMPAAWTAASIGFQVSPTTGGTFIPLYDDDGNLLQIDAPTASKAYQAPDGIAGSGFVKLWSQDGSGSNTAQGAERSIPVTLKG